MFGLGPWMLCLLVAYPVPMIIAFARHHHQRGAIAVINIFLGWSFIGWVVALGWALSAVKRARAAIPPGRGAP